MYAIIRTGGKQYRVAEGDRLKVEKLEAGEGAKLEFLDVLMVRDENRIKVGKPAVAGASVLAEVVEQGLHRKVRGFKLRRRKGYRRKFGHRQPYTEVQITSIQAL